MEKKKKKKESDDNSESHFGIFATQPQTLSKNT